MRWHFWIKLENLTLDPFRPPVKFCPKIIWINFKPLCFVTSCQKKKVPCSDSSSSLENFILAPIWPPIGPKTLKQNFCHKNNLGRFSAFLLLQLHVKNQNTAMYYFFVKLEKTHFRSLLVQTPWRNFFSQKLERSHWASILGPFRLQIPERDFFSKHQAPSLFNFIQKLTKFL